MIHEDMTLAGIHTGELHDRFRNNGKLIKMTIAKFLTDTTCRQPEDAVAWADFEKAELACHMLKDVCGSLALTQLFQLLQEKLRLFRAEEGSAAAAMTLEILALNEKALHYAAQWLNKQ